MYAVCGHVCGLAWCDVTWHCVIQHGVALRGVAGRRALCRRVSVCQCARVHLRVRAPVYACLGARVLGVRAWCVSACVRVGRRAMSERASE